MRPISKAREHAAGILIGCLGFILAGSYLASQIIKADSPADFLERFTVPSVLVHAILVLLFIPIFMLLGYFFHKLKSAHAALPQIVEERARHIREREEIRRSEEKFRSLFNLLADPMVIVDGKGNFLAVNDKVEELTGFKRGELLGKSFLKTKIVTAKSKAILIKNLAKRMIGMHVAPYEVEVITKEGERIPFEINATKIEYNAKSADLVVFRDLRERKRAEEALRESEEKFRNLAEQSPNMIFINKKGRVVYANKKCEEVMGYRKEEFYSPNFDFFTLIAPESADLVKSSVDRHMKEEDVAPFEYTLVTKDGKKIDAIYTSKLIKYEDETAVLGIITDISERKLAEERIRESEEKFRNIFENANDSMIYLDRSGRILDVNRKAVQVFGGSKEELLGKHFAKVGVFSPRDTPTIMKKFAKVLAHKQSTVEIGIKNKNGREIYLECSSSLLRMDDKSGILVIARNITERKAMEKKIEQFSRQLEKMVEDRTRKLKEAQEQLLKSERLAAIGEVAAMVGHDLRNPLTGIAGATYYLKTKLNPDMDEKTREMLELIERDIEYSNKIISDLLEYSREIQLERVETSPRSIIKDALALVHVPENIQILNLAQNEQKIEIDVVQMKRVFVNMIKNSIDAMPSGGEITVASKKSKDNVEIVLADTGTGISKEIAEKIWTPLFTTKAKGMGLGLSVCKRIVEAHGGEISVESAVGKGTKFTVTIPIQPRQGGEEEWMEKPKSLLLTTTKA